jgi:hypothetical protein
MLHDDETPVAMLKPGLGKTHRAYLWSYCTTRCNPTKAVVFDFARQPRRASKPPADIRIELERSGVSVSVSWPVSAAAECATWVREVLR